MSGNTNTSKVENDTTLAQVTEIFDSNSYVPQMYKILLLPKQRI